MMHTFKGRRLARLALGVSGLALASLPGAVWAQDANSTVGATGPSQTPPSPPTDSVQTGTGTETAPASDELVVTGIRASLRASIAIKRDSQGVVDAISAEDIGKFPDTNLAESLQRITGVSIDRSNGEGQFVTVRGFGPEYNLVLLNGRQMPAATIGDGNGAPVSRNFDFANLASEGVAALEVYKSGRATVPSGGIGSTINIRTPRPFDKMGMRGSLSVRGVDDLSQDGSQHDEHNITPELSGIFSDTFADDRIGVLVTGAYQKRDFSVNMASAGWRDGYLGNENNWGSLAQPGDPRAANIINRPDATDVYQVPQNGSYDFADGKRERINGQAVLQFRPVDNLTATVDYTYSRNRIHIRDNSVGIWYNHNDTSSAWTDGPVAGPIFYTERFRPEEAKDLSYSASETAFQTENKSLGGNITWQPTDRLTVSVDGHHSTATSTPTSQYGNSNSLGTAIFGVQSQTLNFEHDLPVMSVNMQPGIDPLNAALITPTGNAFRNSYMRDEINQAQVKGHFDAGSLVDSIDFGFEFTDNKVRSAYSVLQNDTWGGTGGDSAAARAEAAGLLPDELFNLVSIPDKFSGLSGSNDPAIIQSFYSFDFGKVATLLDNRYKICGGDGDCRIPYTTDSRVHERTYSPFLQVNGKFEAFGNPGHLIAGVRYERTNVDATALVRTPVGGKQNSPNEFSVLYNGQDFTSFKGDYSNWLPNVDFDISPMENVKLRASYSHTITRADYGSLQGGRRIDELFRVGGGFGSVGNPGLIPYKSKNIDLSAEWYYGKESYISIGYFHKNVSNFISNTQVNTTLPGVTTPIGGPRYLAAQAALGPNATYEQIRDYIEANYPGTVNSDHQIIAQPDDPLLNFVITTPYNSDQTATVDGFEFAIQHNFWDTGFGTILNYTIVNGNHNYDNTLPSSVSQFAVTGLSDSANAVIYYDKNGIQARLAYNWRKGYLAGAGINPIYINTYGQFDASASWEFKPNMTVFAEGINLTGEDRGGHLRSDNNITFATRQDSRYSLGVRFAF